MTFRVDAAQLMFPAAVQRADEVPAGVEFTSLIRSSEASALLPIDETGENVHPSNLRGIPSRRCVGTPKSPGRCRRTAPSAFPTTGVSTEEGGEVKPRARSTPPSPID